MSEAAKTAMADTAVAETSDTAKDWAGALLIAVILNLALFLIMPALISMRPQKKNQDDIEQLVTLTKVRQELKKPEKKEKPPEPPKEQPKPLKPIITDVAMQQPKLSLPFELNPRLPAVAGGLELPPIDTSLPQADVSGLFSVGDLDGQLMPLSAMPPTYPHGAKRRRVEGWVKLQFVVNEDGTVGDIRVIAAEPKDVFESAARRAVSRWKFKPGTIGGMAVRTKVEQTIKFNLD